jgi:hypothetical protein
MEKGIICFETGEFAPYKTCDAFNALPLLQFIEKTMDVKFIYRQIATFDELSYYLKKIGNKHFRNDYGVVYFSTHGSPGHIHLVGNAKDISFDDIAEVAGVNESFKGQHVHFSSCETLNCDEDVIRRFKRDTGAKSISGYEETVNAAQAYINELAYFHQIFNFSTLQTIRKHMDDYQSQLNKLGFKIY